MDENTIYNFRILRVKKCAQHHEALPCSICEYEEFRDDGITRSYGTQKAVRLHEEDKE